MKKIKEKKCDKEDFFEFSNTEYEMDSLKNYLTYKKLETKKDKINKKEKGTYYQYLATYLSLAGKNKEAEESFNVLLGKSKPNTILSSKVVDINSIVENLKNEKLVIINEAHQIPKHRYFAGLLLKELFEKGFRYFGLEAINVMAELKKNNFPNQDYSFYTKLIYKIDQKCEVIFLQDNDKNLCIA